jgi:hypothetical protein
LTGSRTSTVPYWYPRRGSAGSASSGLPRQPTAATAGSYSTVRDHLARFRGNAVIHGPAPKPPRPRAVTAWIMTRPGDRVPELSYAICHDRYQRSAEGWRFTERVYEVRYQDHSPLAGSVPRGGLPDPAAPRAVSAG